jgi:hypothetical protein
MKSRAKKKKLLEDLEMGHARAYEYKQELSARVAELVRERERLSVFVRLHASDCVCGVNDVSSP